MLDMASYVSSSSTSNNFTTITTINNNAPTMASQHHWSAHAPNHFSPVQQPLQQVSQQQQQSMMQNSAPNMDFMKEIDFACQTLQISADPYNWTPADVRKWLTLQVRLCQLGPLRLEHFTGFNGMTLCSLTENDFRARVGADCGTFLFRKLGIWRAAISEFSDLSFLDSVFEENGEYMTSGFESDSVYSSYPDPPPYPGTQASSIGSSSPASSYGSASPVYGSYPQSSYETSSPYLANYTTMQVKQSPSPVPSPNVYPGSPYMAMSNLPIKQEQPNSPVSFKQPYLAQSYDSMVTSDYGSEGGSDNDDTMSDADIDAYLGRFAPPSTPAKLANPSPSTPIRALSRPHGSSIQLWQFLKELLSSPALYGQSIRWLDRSRGIFKIEDSVRVARLWGDRKNRPAMNYDKLSRSIRQYYKKGIMKKTERAQRLVYQFCAPYAL